jgi:elongation factor P
MRVMVPPHIGVGTRIIINTEDNSYVSRAQD